MGHQFHSVAGGIIVVEAFKNYIGGEWVSSASGESFENINPATGEVLGRYPRSGAEDVDRAVGAARAALPEWSRVPAPKRGEILFRAGQLLVEGKDELARLQTREMGKVLKETRGDLQEGIDMTFFAAGEGRRMLGDTTPSELSDKFAMSVRMPVGVVGAITPWNFPLAIPTWKIMPALVAGNTVVFKPAEDTPESAYRLAQILEEAGLPPGALNVVFGYGEEAGAALVDHEGVDALSFTGSTEVGSQLAQKAPRTHKRISCEMGGKNAIIVMDDADVDLAVEGAVWSAFGTTGQRCTAASRLIVHHDALEEFTGKLVERAKALRLGDGLEPETEMGPLINQAALEKVDRYTQIGKDEGATLLCGGARATDEALARGFFYLPTIFADVEPGMRIAQEEVFGPTTAIIPVGSYEEAIEVVNGTQYGLVASIYTRDVRTAFRAMRDISTGLVYVNAGTTGAEVHLPFGGTKATGNGHREAGQAALEAFTEWKTIFVDFSGRLQKAQIDE